MIAAESEDIRLGDESAYAACIGPDMVWLSGGWSEAPDFIINAGGFDALISQTIPAMPLEMGVRQTTTATHPHNPTESQHADTAAGAVGITLSGDKAYEQE